VGNPEHLAKYGIVPVVSNKAVGENLQDHLMVRSCFYTSSPDTINGMVFSSKKLGREIAKYIFTRRGFFSDASLKATLYAYSDASKSVPDLRIQISLVSATDRIPGSIREGLDPGSAFQIGVYGLYPASRGSVHIQSTDSVDPPAVQPMYLSTDADVSALLSGLKIVKRLSSTAALGEVISSEIRPGPTGVTDDKLLDYARTTGQTCWHPVGTCRMGPDGNSVVDIHCRVRGLAGLRVIDASVFPMLLSSNTNIPTIMLAEKIADQIRYG
jgi:choline dehydrogenase